MTAPGDDSPGEFTEAYWAGALEQAAKVGARFAWCEADFPGLMFVEVATGLKRKVVAVVVASLYEVTAEQRSLVLLYLTRLNEGLAREDARAFEKLCFESRYMIRANRPD